MTGARRKGLTPEEKAWVSRARLSEQAGWVHLRIAGAPFERGFQHGYLMADRYDLALKTYRFITLQTIGKSYAFFVRAAAKLHKHKLGEELTEEMSGIAAGLTKAGVPSTLDDIIGWNAWIELTGSWWPTVKGQHASHDRIDYRRCKCSAFIATGAATADGGVVLAHETFDDFWNGGNLNLVLEIWPSDGFAIIMQSSPCYVASMTDFWLTSGGMVGAETTIAGFNGYDEKGTPEYVRARNAMQYAKDIDGFVDWINDGNNGGYANTWLVGDIDSGEIAEYQQGLLFQKLNRKKTGFFAGANFVTDPRIRNLECQFTGYNDIRQQTGARRTRWPQVIKPLSGRIDSEAAKEMLADHFDLYANRWNPSASTICAHYDVDPRYFMSAPEAVESTPFVGMGSLDGKVTTSAMAREMAMWGRYGRACGTAFDSDDYLARHPQWAWLKNHLPSRPSRPWVRFQATSSAT